jgi:hypothetical protein
MNNVIGVVWGNTYSLANPPIPAAGAPHLVPTIDEGESLVFWLYLVDNDKREPFKALLGTQPGSPEHLFPFKEERFINSDGDFVAAYKAIFSGESAYLYIDSRSYDDLTDDYANPQTRAALAADLPVAGYTRPYWSEDRASTNASLPLWQQFKPKNPTSFQIICAGQDGEFGVDPPALAAPERAVKYFPGGGGPYQPGDNDNMTNFTEGSRLEDKIP